MVRETCVICDDMETRYRVEFRSDESGYYAHVTPSNLFKQGNNKAQRVAASSIVYYPLPESRRYQVYLQSKEIEAQLVKAYEARDERSWNLWQKRWRELQSLNRRYYLSELKTTAQWSVVTRAMSEKSHKITVNPECHGFSIVIYNLG